MLSEVVDLASVLRSATEQAADGENSGGQRHTGLQLSEQSLLAQGLCYIDPIS